jgi:hypothetical protein
MLDGIADRASQGKEEGRRKKEEVRTGDLMAGVRWA